VLDTDVYVVMTSKPSSFSSSSKKTVQSSSAVVAQITLVQLIIPHDRICLFTAL